MTQHLNYLVVTLPLPSNIVVSKGIFQQFYFLISVATVSGIRTKFNTEANVGKAPGNWLGPMVMGKFTRPGQDASQSASVCCRLGPHLSLGGFHLLWWLEILRPDIFNYQEMTQAKSTSGRQEHWWEYDPLFYSMILQYDGTTLGSSENDTQEVA